MRVYRYYVCPIWFPCTLWIRVPKVVHTLAQRVLWLSTLETQLKRSR